MARFGFLRNRVCFFIVTFIFISCADLPDDLVAPSWDVDLNVPLINKTYLLSEIINEDPHITIDTSNGKGIYLLHSDKYQLSSGVDEFLQLNISTSSQNNPVPATENDSAVIYIEFPEGAEIDSAVFENGFLTVSAYNPSLHRADLFLTVPGILDPDNNQVRINMSLESYRGDSVTYNLQNHFYRFPSNQPVGEKGKLQIVGKAMSQVPSETFLLTSYYISDFYFKSISGILPSKSLGNQEEAFGFETGETEEYRNRTTLREAELKLLASYFSPAADPVGVEIRNLKIIGMHKNGGEFYLRDINGSINHNIKFSGTSIEKIYNEQNSNINDFISFLPDTVILNAEYFMNPDREHGTATTEDSLKFETYFSTRSFLSLNSTNIQDKTSIEIGDKDREVIRKNKKADFILELENALPLAVWLKMDLYDADGNFLFTLTNNSNGTDSVYFEPAEIDANGEVISSTVNQPVRITLDSSQVEMLSRTNSANYSVTVSTKNNNQPDPPTVAIRPTSWIKIKGYSTIKYRVND